MDVAKFAAKIGIWNVGNVDNAGNVGNEMW
jgi:hypothetical protein